MFEANLKRSYKDVSDGGLPDEDDDGDDPGGDLAPPPAQRQRVQFEDVCQIPVPEGGDEELDYSPSEGGSGGISNVEEEPEREVSTTPLELPQARNGVGLDPGQWRRCSGMSSSMEMHQGLHPTMQCANS